ncbi:MAG: J domain-containing protein [Acidimicrobiales bacterium]
MARSHYQVLGVAPHASDAEIRRAYRRLARLHHPDANPGSAQPSGPGMAEINVAWEVLGDPERRRVYDDAIGTTPRPRASWGPAIDDDADDELDDDLDHLRDDPADVAARQRPADLLVALPVFLLVIAVATFAFAAMVQSNLLRTVALLLAPVTLAAFAAAPLFAMLRARSRDQAE